MQEILVFEGFVDYALFGGEKLFAVVEAKKVSEDVSSTIDVQVKDYATHIKAEDLQYTLGEWGEYRVPFLFASNGRSYIEQLRTKSGIWFLDARSSGNQPNPIRNWFSPQDLIEKAGQNIEQANLICKGYWPILIEIKTSLLIVI